jgi:hypothetical protein
LIKKDYPSKNIFYKIKFLGCAHFLFQKYNRYSEKDIFIFVLFENINENMEEKRAHRAPDWNALKSIYC